jgi:hypothetical protein
MANNSGYAVTEYRPDNADWNHDRREEVVEHGCPVCGNPVTQHTGSGMVDCLSQISMTVDALRDELRRVSETATRRVLAARKLAREEQSRAERMQRKADGMEARLKAR